ncbi:MAG TPA: hypothetical protein VI702_01065 [Nitrospiria bacterium]
MDIATLKQLGLAILGWVFYFLAVFMVCSVLYIRMRGKPPGRHDAAWEERALRLRRTFIAIAVFLMLLPLLLPFVAGAG